MLYHLAIYEMQDESWAMVPLKDRPSPEELEDYEQRYDNEPDYSGVRNQRAVWLYDHRREEEENRGQDERKPLEGHEPLRRGSISGFDPDSFSLNDVMRQVRPH